MQYSVIQNVIQNVNVDSRVTPAVMPPSPTNTITVPAP